MKDLLKKTCCWFVSLFAYTLPVFTLAAGLNNPLKADSVTKLVDSGMNIVIYVGAIVAVLAIIWVGFMYVKAMGNSDKIKEAHKAFLYTVVGVAILVGAKIITAIITTTINTI